MHIQASTHTDAIGRDVSQIYFANPDSTEKRVNGVIRASEDGVHWSPATQSVFEGAFGYSCLTAMPPNTSTQEPMVGLLWESDGPQCAAPNGKFGSSCRTLFSAFPANFGDANGLGS